MNLPYKTALHAHGCLLLLWCVAATGCSACADPSAITVTGEPNGSPVVISWLEANAMGLYVVTPEAQVPSGPGKTVQGGGVYWVVEATEFPAGFASPVSYGVIPSGAKDATGDHGGSVEPAPLQCGVDYKIAIVALGGSSEMVVQWSCPNTVLSAQSQHRVREPQASPGE